MNEEKSNEIQSKDSVNSDSIHISNFPIKSIDNRKPIRIKKTEKKGFFESQEREISLRETHDYILKLVISPFIKNPNIETMTGMPTLSGYQLFACDPFHEEGNKNFDCLIYKKDSKKVVLVFIEVKTGSNSNTILREFKEKCEEVKRYESKIEEIFDGSENLFYEHVLCVDSMTVDSLKPVFEKEALSSNYKMILWQIGSLQPIKKLKLICPSEAIQSKDAYKLIHGENKFNNYLRKGIDLVGEGPINFFPLSHPVTKLKAFLIFIKSKKALNKIEGETHQYFFTDKDLREYCDYQLLNQSQNFKNEVFNELIQLILKIGLVKKFGEGYTLNEQYQNRSLRADKIEKLWVESKFQDKIYKKSNEMSMDKYV